MATVEALKSYRAELHDVNGNDSRCGGLAILVLVLNKECLVVTPLCRKQSTECPRPATQPPYFAC